MWESTGRSSGFCGRTMTPRLGTEIVARTSSGILPSQRVFEALAEVAAMQRRPAGPEEAISPMANRSSKAIVTKAALP